MMLTAICRDKLSSSLASIMYAGDAGHADDLRDEASHMARY